MSEQMDEVPSLDEEEREKQVDGRELLECFLAMRHRVGEMDKWTEAGLADYPLALLQLRRLKALFSAFGIAWKPEDFPTGRFIQAEDSRYDGAVEAILAECPERGRIPGRHRMQLQSCFRALFDYRCSLEAPLCFSSGLMEASGLYLCAHMKAWEVNGVIREELVKFDRLLVGLISPEGKTFTVAQLIREFGYPDVDLGELEWDWF